MGRDISNPFLWGAWRGVLSAPHRAADLSLLLQGLWKLHFFLCAENGEASQQGRGVDSSRSQEQAWIVGASEAPAGIHAWGSPPGAVVPFFCSDDPINLLTIPVPFFPCLTHAGPGWLSASSLHPSGPQSPYAKKQAPISASGWPPGAPGTGYWAPQQGALGLPLLPFSLPFHGVS